ncbi:hypothetical protein BV375_06095 [Nostoc sp. 106C]|nr:hypothetical protein BV375_06095 [Nostoc sp. 106C]
MGKRVRGKGERANKNPFPFNLFPFPPLAKVTFARERSIFVIYLTIDSIWLMQNQQIKKYEVLSVAASKPKHNIADVKVFSLSVSNLA